MTARSGQLTHRVRRADRSSGSISSIGTAHSWHCTCRTVQGCRRLANTMMLCACSLMTVAAGGSAISRMGASRMVSSRMRLGRPLTHTATHPGVNVRRSVCRFTKRVNKLPDSLKVTS